MATTILGLRILPPYAIARFGSSPTPLDPYELKLPESDGNDPMGYRQIVPKEPLEVDPNTGAIRKKRSPKSIRFIDRDRGEYHIRPVVPFLEVFAQIDEQTLVPLTTGLLDELGLGPEAVQWSVEVANLKVYRQTAANGDEGPEGDKVTARVTFNDHEVHPLEGHSPHFRDNKFIPFGSVRYIRPTKDFPEIRLRFTPAKGLVYGSHERRFRVKKDPKTGKPIKDPKTEKWVLEDDELDDLFKGHEDRIVYDPTKGTWRGFQFKNENGNFMPNPNDIFEGLNSPDPNDVSRLSWGYLDDVCDGPVTVTLKTKKGRPPEARAWVSACMPVFAPDSLPVRTVADELEQLLFGPQIDDTEVSIEEAARLVWRALETVRFINTRVLNGNTIDGRENPESTQVRQDTNDFGRLFAPTFAASIVDNLAVRALHERVITDLRSGCAPWFAQVLRRPDDIGDLSDKERRTMPAMLRGADSRNLTLTRRQISVIVKAALLGPFTR